MLRPCGLAVLAAVFAAQSAHAQGLMEDPARRKLVAPAIRAATDCISREVLNEWGVLDYVRTGHLGDTLDGPIRRCSGVVGFMTAEFDRVYYQGAGETFLKGAYRDDLPRAVLKRIGPEVTRRQAELDRQRADAVRRQAEDDRLRDQKREEERAASERRRAEDERKAAEIRAETERRQIELRAEAEKRDAERKIEAEKRESDRRAEMIRQADLKRQQLDAATKAADILKDRMYTCAAREMQDLVKSGENADVLASAAMTLCSTEVDKALDGLIEAKKIETDAVVGYAEAEAVKTAGRAVIRDRVLANAVKVKAAKASGSTY